MSYYIKTEDKVLDNINNPIKDIYKGFRKHCYNAGTYGGYSHPQFVIKDGSKPVYGIDIHNSDSNYSGYHYTGPFYYAPIMTCIISSFSGYYESIYNSGSNNWNINYNVLTNGIFKQKLYMKDKISIGINDKNDSNTLYWRISDDDFLYFNINNRGPNSGQYKNRNNILNNSLRNYSTTRLSLNFTETIESIPYTANISEHLHFVTELPSKLNNSFKYNEHYYWNLEDQTADISYYTLDINDIKNKGYTGLKVRIEAQTLYNNNNYNNTFNITGGTYTGSDTTFWQNQFSMPATSPYTLHFIYQISNNSGWIHETTANITKTTFYLGLNPNTNYNPFIKDDSCSANVYYCPLIPLDTSGGYKEIQYPENQEFYTHIIPTFINEINSNSSYNLLKLTACPDNYSSFIGNIFDGRYVHPSLLDSNSEFKWTSYEPEYKKYFELNKTIEEGGKDGWEQILNPNNAKIIGFEDNKVSGELDNRYIIYDNYFHNISNFNEVFSGSHYITSGLNNFYEPNSENPNTKYFRKDWYRISAITGANLTFGSGYIEKIIDLNNIDEKYIHISMPATTLLNYNNTYSAGGTSSESNMNVGMITQLEMIYEGTK